MGNFSKWNKGEARDNDKVVVVLFVSRNKDNAHLPQFQERRNAFTTTKSPENLQNEFNTFVEKGLPGEMCRMYISVNERSNEKTFKALQHKMLDHTFNLATMPQQVAAIAAKQENAYDNKHLKWLFDFDPREGYDLNNDLSLFLKEVEEAHQTTQTRRGQPRPTMKIIAHKTPNGYAVVVDQRFDTRKLLEKWTNVELKRDDLYCHTWKTKEVPK